METMPVAMRTNLPWSLSRLPGPPVEEPPPTPGKPDDPDPGAPVDEPGKPPGRQ